MPDATQIRDKLKSLYTDLSLMKNDQDLVLYKNCKCKDDCWKGHPVNSKNPENNKITLPYIGKSYIKSGLVCVGLNQHDDGGLDSHYNIIGDKKDGVIKILKDGGKVDKNGSLLWHRTAVYANIILKKIKCKNNNILSVNDEVLEDDKKALSGIFNDIIYMEAIKCSPKVDRSKPFPAMKWQCIPNIFVEELKIIKPKIILLLSKGTSTVLRQCLKNEVAEEEKSKQRHMSRYKMDFNGKTVQVFAVPHPARYNSKDLYSELIDLVTHA
ncbi:hypothetical protein [Treponema primitia]|nr:hypothetical protein [Treponema primitia]